MTPEQEYDSRIAAIHGLDRSLLVTSEASAMDVRQAEFDAMFEVFLGADYDPAKRQRVEGLQKSLHEKQSNLSHQHDQSELNDEEFLAASHDLLENVFRECENILGPDDFLKLFGAPAEEATGLIDPTAFLAKSSDEEATGRKSGAPIIP